MKLYIIFYYSTSRTDEGTKRDCWFCTMHTLLCQIINLWSRVVRESVQFYGLVGKCVQNHQSLLVPLFSIVYTKIGWQFCTHLQSHKVKENVQFYKSYQKRLMILHYAYTFVQNHQNLKNTKESWFWTIFCRKGWKSI